MPLESGGRGGWMTPCKAVRSAPVWRSEKPWEKLLEAARRRETRCGSGVGRLDRWGCQRWICWRYSRIRSISVSLDLTTPGGRVMVGLLAILAECNRSEEHTSELQS